MYEIRILDVAIADLKKIDKDYARRIKHKIIWIANNSEQIGCDKLKEDLADFCKYKVGKYRIIYELDTTNKIIIIHRIGHRKSIYK